MGRQTMARGTSGEWCPAATFASATGCCLGGKKTLYLLTTRSRCEVFGVLQYTAERARSLSAHLGRCDRSQHGHCSVRPACRL